MSSHSQLHRQQVSKRFRSQTGVPIAPARWATAVSTLISQVEIGDQGGGLGEVGQVAGEVVDHHARRRVARLQARFVLLQGYEGHAGRRVAGRQLARAEWSGAC